MGQVERDAEASSGVAQSVLKSSNALSGETDMLWAQIEAFVEHVASGDSRAYHRSACDATITHATAGNAALRAVGIGRGRLKARGAAGLRHGDICALPAPVPGPHMLAPLEAKGALAA